MQVISMDKEDAFEVTPLQIAILKLQQWACAQVQQFTSRAPLDRRPGRHVYHSRQDSAPRFIVVFVGQLKALRNSSKLLIAPITLQRQKKNQTNVHIVFCLTLQACKCFSVFTSG